MAQNSRRFQELYEVLDEGYGSLDDRDLSPTEQRYRRRVIALALDIADQYGSEILDDVEG
jgi:hypothetical protein